MSNTPTPKDIRNQNDDKVTGPNVDVAPEKDSDNEQTYIVGIDGKRVKTEDYDGES